MVAMVGVNGTEVTKLHQFERPLRSNAGLGRITNLTEWCVDIFEMKLEEIEVIYHEYSADAFCMACIL